MSQIMADFVAAATTCQAIFEAPLLLLLVHCGVGRVLFQAFFIVGALLNVIPGLVGIISFRIGSSRKINQFKSVQLSNVSC